MSMRWSSTDSERVHLLCGGGTHLRRSSRIRLTQETKKEWQADVMELQQEITFDKNEEMKGREL